ncbi:MAG: hypothetical protein CL489_00785 [Acidobacteria bacterium]|nr:hypothetical protein [Acidobacteriota bacterium]|tara:strand:- start:69 stop:257 length:189 start_codon:yes stop_codon:yes gene_type:complete
MMYSDTQVAEMLQRKDRKIEKWWTRVRELLQVIDLLEKEIVSLNTYVGQLENRLNNEKVEDE